MTTVSKSNFGKYTDGREVTLYTLKNENGMEVSLCNIGAAIVKIMAPDAEGKLADMVLGFDDAAGYLANPSFFGIVVGPSANRIGNASYTIDGVTYQAAVNDGVNNLHSDFAKGYHKLFWEAEEVEGGVKFTMTDEDGYLGFPGNKKMTITYTLDEKNALKLQYHATSDKKTILNPTNHTYFNLDGHDSGSIEAHEMWIKASNFTPADAGSIPTGEIAPVKGTPMDFTVSKVVGKEIGADFTQLIYGKGYDHNWVIDDWKNDGTLQLMAEVKAAKSGRKMKVFTTLPGVQFYAGNCIAPQQGKGGANYGFRSGLCLETQFFPDSVNKPQFPACVFGGDTEYDSVTVYQFEA